MASHETPLKNPYPLDATLGVVKNIRDVKDGVDQTGGQAVVEILRASRELETADPRDKVFGMLGLLDVENANHKLLEPDYTKPIPDVFRNAVRYHITHVTDFPLGICRYISHRKYSDLTTGGFPSWAPRFDLPFDLRVDPAILGALHGGDMLTELAEVPRNANIDEPGVLVLTGMDLCYIRKVSIPYRQNYNLGTPENQDEMLAWYQAVASMLQSSHVPEGCVIRTLVADIDVISFLPLENAHIGFEAWLQCGRDQVIVPSYRGLDSSVQDSTRQASRFVYSARSWCRQRRFAIMSGGTVGLVPLLTRPTDLVVMMHGSDMPLVLRPHGEDFLIIGNCYADGWMCWQEHGEELLQMMRDPNPKTYRIR